MRIIEFGLLETFPEEAVPIPVAVFCQEVDGTDFAAAIERADRLGYQPCVKKLSPLGDDIWGFGLVFAGRYIPLMVRVEYREAA